jgi:hypothetical protein
MRYSLEFGIFSCILLAALGDVTASSSPTKISVRTLILDRASVVSDLPAMASNAPQMPTGEFDRMVPLISSMISGLVLKV